MTRLPDLERALFDAAQRLDAQSVVAPTVAQERRHARRWRRRSSPLLAVLATLALGGAALAAAVGVLDNGTPVPRSSTPAQPVARGEGLTLASVRAADPAGGPPWGIGTYDAIPAAAAARVPDAVAAQFAEPVTCVVVGRVQGGQLGVVGRDGVFGNDGRFHQLAPAAQSSSVCGGREKDGAFVNFSSGPPIPASGYTGAPATSIGGCRERGNLNRSTVSPQTRRKLRGVAQCSVAGLRRVVAGFAGPRAASARLIAAGARKTLKLQPNDNGAYLFVVRSASDSPVRLSITDGRGNICQPLELSRLNGCRHLLEADPAAHP